MQAPAKAFRRGDIILPVVPGGGLRPPGLLWVWSAGWHKPRASPWEGKKLVPRMVSIYENHNKKGRIGDVTKEIRREEVP